MRKSWIYVDGVAYERGQEPPPEALHVIGDIAPFMSPDGTFIEGKRAWREHLKATDSVEMSHADIKYAQNEWAKRKAANAERLRGAAGLVREFDAPGEVREVRRSNLNVEMAQKLHGRPPPDRKEMIKMTLEVAKRMQRR